MQVHMRLRICPVTISGRHSPGGWGGEDSPWWLDSAIDPVNIMCDFPAHVNALSGRHSPGGWGGEHSPLGWARLADCLRLLILLRLAAITVTCWDGEHSP